MILTEGQRSGAIVLLIACLAAYGGTLWRHQWPERPSPLPWGTQDPGTEAVEVAVGSPADGIYFLSTRMELLALLKQAGLSGSLNPEDLPGRVDRPSRVQRDDGRVHLVKMPAKSCIALGLPIDLNGASQEDLMRIPGIGEKTAAAIVMDRRKRGDFRQLSDLKRVPGIRDARLQRLASHLKVYQPER